MDYSKVTNALQPNHYTRFKIQPLDFIIANGIGFVAGNVIKYVCRHDAKNGVEDLKKARVYLDRMIDEAEKAAEAKRKADLLKVSKCPACVASRTDIRVTPSW